MTKQVRSCPGIFSSDKKIYLFQSTVLCSLTKSPSVAYRTVAYTSSSQPEGIRIVADFAAFCLLVYVPIDDPWNALPAWVKLRGIQSECSNSELLTMLVAVEECMGWGEETVALSQWQQHRDLFPRLPDRTRLNQWRRRLSDVFTLIRQDRQCAINSMPVPHPMTLCEYGRNVGSRTTA